MFQQLGKQALRQARMVKVDDHLRRDPALRPRHPRRDRQDPVRLGHGVRGRHGRARDPLARGRRPGRRARRAHLGEIDERSTRLAHGLQDLGVSEGDSVAVLCRNHRYFVDASTALSKLGADILYLNTAFSGTQLGEVCDREKPAAIVYDEEFTELIEKSGIDLPKVIAWHDGETGEVPLVEELIEKGSTDKHPVPEHATRPVILTSGTTGTPKGAPRGESGLDGAVALLSKMPFKTGGTTYIVAPLFHTWGWAHLNMAMLLGSKMVLRRKFDPKDCLETIREHDCDALIVIPVMMQRIMKLAEEDALGRLVQPQRRRRVGIGVAGRPGHRVDGRVRRQPLQHLRLDRGRVGHDRPARGHARGPRDGRQGAVQHGRAHLRQRRQPGRGR